MRDLLPTLRYADAGGRDRDGGRAARLCPARRRRIAALNDLGEIAGLGHRRLRRALRARRGTGGARRRPGAPPRVRHRRRRRFQVGLACGGTVGILIARLDTSFIPELQDAVRADWPIAFGITAAGDASASSAWSPRRRRALVDVGGETIFVHAFNPRPALYASARSTTLQRSRGSASSSAIASPSATRALPSSRRSASPRRRARRRVARPLLRRARVDESTAICVLTSRRSSTRSRPIAALETPPSTSARWAAR